MSSPGDVSCPTCHVPTIPGSTFCTRCGAALPVREIVADLGGAQQWGNAPARRGRRRGHAEAPGVGGSAADRSVGSGTAAPVLSFDTSGGGAQVAGAGAFDRAGDAITAAT